MASAKDFGGTAATLRHAKQGWRLVICASNAILLDKGRGLRFFQRLDLKYTIDEIVAAHELLGWIREEPNEQPPAE